MAAAVAVGLLQVAAPATALPARSEARPAVLEVKVLGTSVAGRKIRAWHLGQRQEEFGEDIPTVVLISTMHGNERATQQILASLRDGAPVYEVDLWVVPVYNPDGLARNTRRNAHGVDLNRNYPYDWADLDGNYESGPKPGSEPETKAMMRFLTEIRPDFDPQLPPAAQRRRHQRAAAEVRPHGGQAPPTCRPRTSTAAACATAP